jgi:hypothetical protein
MGVFEQRANIELLFFLGQILIRQKSCDGVCRNPKTLQVAMENVQW